MPIFGRQVLKGAGVPLRKRVVINDNARPVDRDTLTASEQRLADAVLDGFDQVPPTAFLALLDNPNDTSYEQAIVQAFSQVETDIAAELHLQVTAGGTVAAQELSRVLVDQFTALTQKADRPTPVEIAARFTFNPQHPEALAWSRRNAGRLITNMARDQRDAIRALISDATGANTLQRRQSALTELLSTVRPGTPAGRAVAQTFGANVNGLTRRYERAVFNNAQTIAADLAAQGITGTKALEVVRNKSDKYAARLRRARSRTIARTETMRALNEGRQQAWEQAAEQGLINKQTARKTWVTGPMDVCPTCQPLNGTSVPLDGQWKAGAVMVRTPPAHPNCRCSMTIATLPTQQARGLGTGQPGDPLRIDYGAKPKLDDYPPLPQPGTAQRLPSGPVSGPSAPTVNLPPLPNDARLISPGGDVVDFHVLTDGTVRIQQAGLERDAQAVWRRFNKDGVQEEFIPARNSVAGRVERHIKRNPDLVKPGPAPIVTPPRVPDYTPLTEDEIRALVNRQRAAGVTRDAMPQYEDAIVQYTNGSGDYSDINLSLRRREWFPRLRDTQQDRIGGYINSLDDVIEASPRLERPTLLYRGVKDDALGQYGDLKVGDVITEPGFASTSTSRGIAERFANPSNAKRPGMVLEIEAPAGTKGVHPLGFRTADEKILYGQGYNEAEILLQRGTKFEVVSVSDDVVRLRIVEQPKPARFYTRVDPVGDRVIVPADGKVPAHIFEPDGRVVLQDKDEYRDAAGNWYRKVKGTDKYEPFTPARNSAAGTLDRHLKRTGVKPTATPTATTTVPTPPKPSTDPLAVDISDLQPRIDPLRTTKLARNESTYANWTPTGEQEGALDALTEAGERVERRIKETIEVRTATLRKELDEAEQKLRAYTPKMKEAEEARRQAERDHLRDLLRKAGLPPDSVQTLTRSSGEVTSYWDRKRLVEALSSVDESEAASELLDSVYPWFPSERVDFTYGDRLAILRARYQVDDLPVSGRGMVQPTLPSGRQGGLWQLADPTEVEPIRLPDGHPLKSVVHDAIREQGRLSVEVGKIKRQIQQAERQAVFDVLRATRPGYGSGADLATAVREVRGSRTLGATEKLVRDALGRTQRLYPKEWIDGWLDATSTRGRWLVKFGKRGHYDHSNKEVWLSGTDWQSTLTHEMGHGMDYTTPGLGRAHALFYRRRMALLGIKDSTPKIRIYKGKQEFAWDLKLRTDVISSNLYSSKLYGRENSWELLTMAMEELFHKGHFFSHLDPVYRHYILGLLVGL